ncbi:hypothetical protein BDM02DRAFT_3114213 [Thelephora ganbajun]|uniref:Uncharacterized protein n=1 Tax=Thelephora ganbajun TaxID=370292 RepID=A0ACB6ZHQ7_THEGA|nr:hypothetical protein BDM02DRAFT_3114213 [Thelephora ganbajun]
MYTCCVVSLTHTIHPVPAVSVGRIHISHPYEIISRGMQCKPRHVTHLLPLTSPQPGIAVPLVQMLRERILSVW